MATVIKFLSSGRMERIPGLQLFLVLQLMDVVTTLTGFELGLGEASPFVRILMHFGPAAGVIASKIVAILLAAFCVTSRRYRVIRYVNVWYAILVLWNLTLILAAV